MRCVLLLLIVLISCPALSFAQANSHIAQLAERTMAQWKVPGLALVVVQGDQVVFLKGFGVRATGKPEPVTADTVFPIASCTKSFTTLALGMLVDDDKLDWDDPVRKHVPYFHLSDPLADASVTLRDLVTHRTGVASHDLLWYGSSWSLEERIRHAGKLDLAAPFRTSFRYQVVFFGAAGVAAGNAAGSSWQAVVQTRILDALDMKSTRCVEPTGANGDVARPHRKDAAGQPVVIPRFPLADADPAGSIHSTARDLARYLRFQLGDGTWQGKRLISKESLAEPQTPQIVLRLSGGAKAMNPETLFLHYGMGWIVQDYRGKKLLMHGGSIDGFRAHLTLVPETRLGIGLLTNLDGGLANVALSNSIVDLLLGTPTRDWSSHYLKLYEDGERDDRERAKELRARRDPSKEPRPLKAYTGTYHDAAYGECRVELEDGKLYWHWQKVRCPLEPYEGDTFLANYGPLVDTGFFFAADAFGTVQGFRAFERAFRRK